MNTTGPHGIDLSIPRGVTRNQLRHKHAETIARLKREVDAKRKAEHEAEQKRGQG